MPLPGNGKRAGAIEICCGHAGLTAALVDAGLEAFGIDWKKRTDTVHRSRSSKQTSQPKTSKPSSGTSSDKSTSCTSTWHRHVAHTLAREKSRSHSGNSTSIRTCRTPSLSGRTSPSGPATRTDVRNRRDPSRKGKHHSRLLPRNRIVMLGQWQTILRRKPRKIHDLGNAKQEKHCQSPEDRQS